MRKSTPTERRQWFALIILMPMITMLLLTVSGVFVWSPLNCGHEEVDINTGRVRHTKYFLFYQIGDRTEDTWVSRASSKSNKSPDWHRVNTFSPGVGHSPHYNFHGAIHQITTLERADNMVRCHRALETGPPVGASNRASCHGLRVALFAVGIFGRRPGGRFGPF